MSGGQRLTGDQRRNAFLAASIVVVAGVVAIGALGNSSLSAATGRHTSGSEANGLVPRIVDVSAPPPTSTRTQSPGASPAPTSSTKQQPASPPQEREQQAPGSSASGQRLIIAHARQFLSAYLVYEVEPLDARMRRALVRATTVAFSIQLLRHPVDLPRGHRPAVGTVQALELSESPDTSAITVDATILDDSWVSGLILDFQSAGGQWLVSGLS